jgi:hypothetical protein
LADLAHGKIPGILAFWHTANCLFSETLAQPISRKITALNAVTVLSALINIVALNG